MLQTIGCYTYTLFFTKIYMLRNLLVHIHYNNYDSLHSNKKNQILQIGKNAFERAYYV